MEYLETAQIVSVHGLKGEVRVNLWCDDAEFFESFDVFYAGDEKKEMRVLSARPHKNIMIVKFEGVDSPEAAEALRGTVLYIDKEEVDLPERTYFYDDLLGLEVRDADSGRVYGKLTNIQETGANDIYEVKNGKKSVWIPAIPSVIKKTDLENKVMLITPIEGLMEGLEDA